MKLFSVYAHLNNVNGKIYIGITSQKPSRRWDNGKGYRQQPHIRNGIEKHGWDNFEHEIVASNLDEQSAKNFEKLLIKTLMSNNAIYGYNITDGGEGTLGWSPSKEHRAIMSMTHKGKVISEEQKVKFRLKMVGRQETPEHRLKISIAGKGRILSEETKNKMRKPKSSKTIIKMSKPKTKEHANNIGKSRKIPINQIDVNTNEIIKIWASATDVQKELGFWQPTISEYAKKSKCLYGFMWECVKKEEK